ncbi:MAG: PAS domain-containing protein [Sphingomonadales bacterium]|nr:PAS domain-containing protein [Sphingomonadales bacterium]
MGERADLAFEGGNDPAFLEGGGEMARRIAGFDWAATPIGPIDAWPPVLRHTVSLMLSSPVPMVLLWGEAGVMVYNDAYAVFAGGRESRLLGSLVREGWEEVADFNDNVMRVGLAGNTLSYKDHELTLYRDGRPEQVFLNLDYAPVRGDDGCPAGVLAVVVETTEARRNRLALEGSETRLRFLDAMSRAVSGERDADAILATITRMTGEHLGCSNCAWSDMDEDEDGLTIRGDWQERDTQSIVGHYRLASFGARAVAELKAGRPLIIADCQGELALEAAQAYRELGIGASLCMPLLRQGRLVALMAIHHRTAHRWSEYELGVIAEVTERSWAHIQRVGAEDALRRSEAQLRRAQAAGGIGLFAIDVRTDTLTGTDEFSRIFGLGPCHDMPAQVIEDLVIGPDRAVVSNAARRLQGTATLDVEYRIRRADDGEERTIARKAEYEFDADGAPVRLIGVVQDVTDRDRIRLALARSEAKFSALAQNMPNQVWTARADGSLDWFNDQAYAYCGLAPGSLLGDGWRHVLHPDDLPRAIARWTQAVAGGRTYEAEFRIRDAAGVYRWHLARAVPLLEAGADTTAWVGTNTEIEAQKRAEEASARDRDRLWTMSQDLMLVCDHAGRITAINPSGERLLGWPESEMIGRLLGDFVHPEDRDGTMAEFARVTNGATSQTFENRYRTRDGDYRLMAWTAVGDGSRVHGVGRDVTDQRGIEEALRQSQKMEAVGQLTGGIAHDFNNLLQGIVGGLDMIAQRLEERRADDIPRWLGAVRTSADRAAALTHRLLAFSRRQPLDPRPLKVNPLVASMEDLLRRTLGEAMALRLVLAGGLWPTLCDANQLESAILNLAINARDAMPGGGALAIETANIDIDGHDTARDRELRAGQYVCIAVTDSGTGMSRETIERAFEPFYTTKPIGQGTGLGLSMIYGFARQSGGFARIDSELGVGSTIRLYLPRHIAGDDAPETDAPVPAPGVHAEGETVLVVEDEFLVRGLIVEVLEELGYRVIEANDGPKGLEVLQSGQRIDLLLTDIGLPGLNGRQLADAARVARPDLKVMFMTGYAENAAIASGFLDPGMAMITKPFAMDMLAKRVADILTA